MSSANRGECVTTGGLYRTTRLCVAHFELHQKVEMVEWKLSVEMVHVSGGMGFVWVSESGGVS